MSAVRTRAATTEVATAPRGRRAGFALISVLVAIVLVATGVMAIGAASALRARQQAVSAIRTDALNIARGYIESVRAQDPWTLASVASQNVNANGVVTAGGPYTRKLDVTVLNTNLLLVVVEVSGPRLRVPVRLTTNIYRAAITTM